MTLADIPDRREYRIEKVSASDTRESVYVKNGLRAGRRLKLLCRHPLENPVILECELDNELRLSIPAALAGRVTVRAHLEAVDSK